jgi:hypothetical protein
MAEVFHDLPQALSSTIEIVERCTLEIETGVYHRPEFEVASHTTRDAVLREQAWVGLRSRLGLAPDEPVPEARQSYVERLQMELDTICKMGFEATSDRVKPIDAQTTCRSWAGSKRLPGRVFAWHHDRSAGTTCSGALQIKRSPRHRRFCARATR